MPAAEVAALRMVTPARTDCPLCSLTIYCEDAYNAGTRHARCGRFLASLDARRATRKEELIAA